jgi:hypothetical protein
VPFLRAAGSACCSSFTAYRYVCVIILLYMCPHTAIYVSSYYYPRSERLASRVPPSHAASPLRTGKEVGGGGGGSRSGGGGAAVPPELLATPPKLSTKREKQDNLASPVGGCASLGIYMYICIYIYILKCPSYTLHTKYTLLKRQSTSNILAIFVPLLQATASLRACVSYVLKCAPVCPRGDAAYCHFKSVCFKRP